MDVNNYSFHLLLTSICLAQPFFVIAKDLRDLFHLPRFGMDFLSTRPQMTFAGAGSGTSFAAEVFSGRPNFADIQGFQGVMDDIALEVQTSMQRPGCRLASVDLIIDKEGLLGIFVFQVKHTTGNRQERD